MLASGALDASQLAVASTHVYFITLSDSSIRRVPKSGGSIETIAANQTGPRGIATDDAYVYWGVSNSTGTEAVKRAPLDGGVAEVLVVASYGVASLAVDATNVTFLAQAFSGSSGGVYRVAKTGGSPPPLSSPLTIGTDLAIDTSSAYWVQNGSSVRKVPLGGGTVTTLVNGEVSGGPIEVGTTHVYWIASGKIRRVPLAGGTAAPLVFFWPPSASATDLTLDGELFWVERDSGYVWKSPADGGENVVLAHGQDRPSWIAFDSTHIYWINSGVGSSSIMRVAR